MLSTFQINLEEQSLRESYGTEYGIYEDSHTVAGITITINIAFHNNNLYVYYKPHLNDIVDEVELTACASILNENHNKCRQAFYTHTYTLNNDEQWGRPLHQFDSFGSIEHYMQYDDEIHNDVLIINIDIIEMVRKPDDRVLLERIYKATNAREQALYEAKLAEQEKCNKKQEVTIGILTTKNDSLNKENEKLMSKLEHSNCAKEEDGTDDSNSNSSGSNNSSNDIGGGGTKNTAKDNKKNNNKINLKKCSDDELNKLQRSILKEQKQRTKCVICLDKKINITFIPCGHRKVCNTCADILGEGEEPKCPICREKIERTIKTF